MMKLGKLKPEFSEKDFQFSNLMKAVIIPAAYDWDLMHPESRIPMPMFLNDKLGCCVISGRAHQTMRFELLEQRRILPITDDEVRNEYFKQTGGLDEGLVVSQSLKSWRSNGWTVGGKVYKIKAFSRIATNNRTQIKAAMYSDLGVGLGFEVPAIAMDQFERGEPWTVVDNDGGIEGGHYVYCIAYNPFGITCISWGKRQYMTWEFYDKHADETWAIIDDRNLTMKQLEVLDVPVIDEYLSAIKSE